MTEQAPPDPVLRIEKGEPTDQELAALLAAISARLEAGQRRSQERPSNWAAYWRSVRAPLSPGPGAWRASAKPG